MSDAIQSDLDSLSDVTRWALEKADGYMDLKMWAQAQDELNKVSPDDVASIAYRHTRLRLAIENEDWPTSTDLVTSLQKAVPEEPAFWVQHAYVARRAESIHAARTILCDALGKFPQMAVIPFNLACYECQLGELQLAHEYLQAAFELDPSFRDLALRDEDLEPLWGDLTG